MFAYIDETCNTGNLREVHRNRWSFVLVVLREVNILDIISSVDIVQEHLKESD